MSRRQTATTAAWTPGDGDGTGTKCDNCGAHVSRQFRRCFEDENGVVHGCPECCAKSRIARAHMDDEEERRKYGEAYVGCGQ